jgi:hypothetical protein
VNLAPADTAKVEIAASHPRFAIPMYSGTKVHVEIDGDVSIFPWGTHSIDVAPGRHSVVVWYRGFNNHGNQAWIWVEVEAGATACVTYRAPKFGSQEGTIESDHAIAEPTDLPQDLSDLSDALLIEGWKDFTELVGRDPVKRFALRKMRAEYEQELKRRGFDPESLGFGQ